MAENGRLRAVSFGVWIQCRDPDQGCSSDHRRSAPTPVSSGSPHVAPDAPVRGCAKRNAAQSRRGSASLVIDAVARGASLRGADEGVRPYTI